jgi:hypothetical protein
MELSQILNETIPNAGPQARAAIAEAERRLAMLDGTDPKRAKILREQAIKQISLRDEGITNTLADIGKLHGSSLGRVEPQDKASEDQSNVARSFEQLVSVADSRNIAIPPAILYDAANAFVSKDEGAVAALANSIGSLVDAGIKVQQDEQKKQTQLTDGSIVLIGSQSGTRYDNMGNPIPFGSKNAEVFSGFAEKSFAPTRDVMASVPGLGDVITTQVRNVPVVPATQAGQIDIGANPEAYAATQVPDFTSTQLTEQAIAEARDLYDQGNPVEAAQKLNAFRIRGILGGAVSPNELVDIFGERRIKKTTPTPATPAAPSKKPLGEILK